MELFWNDRLQTRIHLILNQKLKYLNFDSTHIPSCFKSISQGVLKQLSQLTIMTKENQTKSLEELYSHQATLTSFLATSKLSKNKLKITKLTKSRKSWKTTIKKQTIDTSTSALDIPKYGWGLYIWQSNGWSSSIDLPGYASRCPIIVFQTFAKF